MGQGTDGDKDKDSSHSVREAKEKRVRRRGTIFCKHGCGFKYISSGDRKLRDQFDYHEQQKCPQLPRLVCVLECQYRGKVLSFAGQKALRQHLNTKSHVSALEALEQKVGSEAFKKKDWDGYRNAAELAPYLVHGNPRINGFRRRHSDNEEPSRPQKHTKKPKQQSENNDSGDDDIEAIMKLIFDENVNSGRARKDQRAKRGRERGRERNDERNGETESLAEKSIKTDPLPTSSDEASAMKLASFASQVLNDLSPPESPAVVWEGPSFFPDRNVFASRYSSMLKHLLSPTKKEMKFKYI